MADFIGGVLLVSGVFIVGGLLGLRVGASLHRQSVNPEKEQEESEKEVAVETVISLPSREFYIREGKDSNTKTLVEVRSGERAKGIICLEHYEVSTPTLEFILFFLKNHRKFKLTKLSGENSEKSYTLEDTINGKTYRCDPDPEKWWRAVLSSKGGNDLSFLTSSEKDFLYNQIEAFYNNRHNRKIELVQTRSRKELTKLYKGE